jgi:hypothetical protein
MSSPTDSAMDPADALAEAAVDVLEKQAFMLGERCPKHELVTEADTFWLARMEFSGPAWGELGIEMPAGACGELAANMLGVDTESSLTREDAADALGELLNVICGQWLTARYGVEPVFDLSIPQVVEEGCVEWETTMAAAETIGLLVDDEPALVYLKQGEGSQ